MRASFPWTVLFSTTMAVVLLGSIGHGEEENNSNNTSSSCVNSLIPCTPYVTSAGAVKPPASCCNPLLSALEKQRQCLCTLLNNNGVAALGVTNISQALDLPSRCGSNLTTSICTTKENGNSQTSNSTSTTTTPSQSKGTGDNSASASSSHLPPVLMLALLSVACFFLQNSVFVTFKGRCG